MTKNDLAEILEAIAKVVGVIIIFTVLLGGIFLLSSYILMLVWNWIAVGLFNAPALTIWTAMGLHLLLGIIGSFFKNTNK